MLPCSVELAQTKLLSLQDDLGSSGHGGARGSCGSVPQVAEPASMRTIRSRLDAQREASIRSAHFSPILMQAALALPETTVGKSRRGRRAGSTGRRDHTAKAGRGSTLWTIFLQSVRLLLPRERPSGRRHRFQISPSSQGIPPCPVWAPARARPFPSAMPEPKRAAGTARSRAGRRPRKARPGRRRMRSGTACARRSISCCRTRMPPSSPASRRRWSTELAPVGRAPARARAPRRGRRLAAGAR